MMTLGVAMIALSACMTPADGIISSSAASTKTPVEKDTAEIGVARVLLYEVAAEGVEERVASLFTDALLAELRKLVGLVVVDKNEIRVLLEVSADQIRAGCNDTGCLSEIADALGAQTVIMGRIVRVGDEETVSVRRLNSADASVVASSTRRLASGDGEELLLVVGEMVEEIFADRPLRKGASRGVDERMVLRLNPPPLAPVVFQSLVGASSIATLAGGLTGAVWLGMQIEYALAVDEATRKTVDGSALSLRWNTTLWTGVGALAFLASAIAFGAAAAVSMPFTDWDRIADDDRRRE